MSSLIEFYIPWLKNKQQKNNHASGKTLTDNGKKTSLRPLSYIGELIKRRDCTMVAIILLGRYYLQSYNYISCYKLLNEKFGIKEYISSTLYMYMEATIKLNKYFYIWYYCSYHTVAFIQHSYHTKEKELLVNTWNWFVCYHWYTGIKLFKIFVCKKTPFVRSVV